MIALLDDGNWFAILFSGLCSTLIGVWLAHVISSRRKPSSPEETREGPAARSEPAREGHESTQDHGADDADGELFIPLLNLCASQLRSATEALRSGALPVNRLGGLRGLRDRLEDLVNEYGDRDKRFQSARPVIQRFDEALRKLGVV